MKRNKLKLRKKYLKNSLTMNIIKKLKTYRQQQWKKPSCQVKYENPATKRKTENNPGYDDIRREQLKYSPEVIENSMCETKRSSRNNSAPPQKKPHPLWHSDTAPKRATQGIQGPCTNLKQKN